MTCDAPTLQTGFERILWLNLVQTTPNRSTTRTFPFSYFLNLFVISHHRKVGIEHIFRNLRTVYLMTGSSEEESTPVPGHVSVDNCNDSSSAPSMSPVTLESSSPSSAKKHLFRDEIMTGVSTFKIQCDIAAPNEEEMLRKKSEMFTQKKMNEILTCLDGVPAAILPSGQGRESIQNGVSSDSAKVVDLWHLRQLALTTGGLLNASTRKQVWLKLVEANEDVLMSPITLASIQGEEKSNSEIQHVQQLSNKEIKMIQMDIKRCVWNIEAEIKRSKMLQRHGGKQTNVSFTCDDASLMSFESASGQFSPNLHPPEFSDLPTSDDKTHISQDTKGSGSTTTRTTRSGSVIRRSSKRKREERSLLLNIITSVLRTSPDKVGVLGMERFFYFPGMHNVVAPILITLQSPSLTSLVMKRLSQYHLKDSMMPTFSDIQSTIRAIFMPLLEAVDKPLHDMLIQNSIKDPCTFALRWVLCWFASDISDYDIISRLFDVFLVSHYTHPIYLSVAMLTSASNRSSIEAAVKNRDQHLSDLLSSLPSIMVSSQSGRETMNSIEAVISTSLEYMYVSMHFLQIFLGKKT